MHLAGRGERRDQEDKVRAQIGDTLSEADGDEDEQAEELALVVLLLLGHRRPLAQPEVGRDRQEVAQEEDDHEADHQQRSARLQVLGKHGQLHFARLDLLLLDDLGARVALVRHGRFGGRRLRSIGRCFSVGRSTLGSCRRFGRRCFVVGVGFAFGLDHALFLFARRQLPVGQIVANEVGKGAVLLEQLVVGAHLADIAAVQHDYLIALWQVAHRVGDEKTRLAAHDARRSNHIVEYGLADVSVHGAQRVVEHVDLGVGVERSCQADALLLAARQVDSLLAYLCLIARRHDVQVGLE